MKKIYIDGQEGTTGLKLQSMLAGHGGVELVRIDEDNYKDPALRRKCMEQADLIFLCLPDQAAKEAVSLAKGTPAKMIDASTAHRTAPGWVYGFPELSATHREKIAVSPYIANPGCHATGFISIAYPLLCTGIVEKRSPLACYSLTGYSGGGKKMILEYESEGRDRSLDSPRQYGLGLNHKHLPEMQAVTGLKNPPLFTPVVCDFYSGMAVSVSLPGKWLHCKISELFDLFSEFYAEAKLISVCRAPASGFIAANELSGTNRLKIYIMENQEQAVLTAVFDNLGKGASGAAIQNMNIALGLEETQGLL